MKKRNSEQKRPENLMQVGILLGFFAGIFLFLNIFITYTWATGGPTCPPCYTGPNCDQKVCCDCYTCVPTMSYPPCQNICDVNSCMSCVGGIGGSCSCKLCGGGPCQECVDGSCQTCGGRPCEVCDNGTCKPVKIKSYTRANLPDNHDRPEIGIGELVDVFTDPPATVDWEKEGDGYMYPSGIPCAGVIFAANQEPTSVCFHIKTGSNECDTKTFSVIAPSSETYEYAYSEPVGTHWSRGDGDEYLGANSYFFVFVEPQTVSFCNAYLQENFGPGTNNVWPNGDIWGAPSGIKPIVPPPLGDGNLWMDQQAQPSLENGRIKLYTWDHMCLTFSPIFPIPIQYLNNNCEGVTFYTATGFRVYQCGSFTTTAGVDGSGEPQGPWKGQ